MDRRVNQHLQMMSLAKALLTADQDRAQFRIAQSHQERQPILTPAQQNGMLGNRFQAL